MPFVKISLAGGEQGAIYIYDVHRERNALDRSSLQIIRSMLWAVQFTSQSEAKSAAAEKKLQASFMQRNFRAARLHMITANILEGGQTSCKEDPIRKEGGPFAPDPFWPLVRRCG